MTTDNEVQPLHLRIPPFEGHHVHATGMKITGAMPMDGLEGVVVSIDDVVTMICQFKVINVLHNTTAKGELVRVQVLRPILMETAPMNPEDPNDDGIIRAMPQIVSTKVQPVCTCGSIDMGHERDCALVKVLQMEGALDDGQKLYLGFTDAPSATPELGAGE